MTKKDIEGFLSNPFFVALKPNKEDSIEVESLLNNAFKFGMHENDYPFERLLSDNGYRNDEFNQKYIAIVKRVFLEYLIQEDALKYFCLPEEYDKVVELINRKQITAKQVVAVLSRLSYFLNASHFDLRDLSLILKNDIKRQITSFENDYVIKSMGPFKKRIDSIASGVNLKCYLDFNKNYFFGSLSDELTSYIAKTHGYKIYNDNEYLKKTTLEKVLSLAILNDEKFWNFNYPSKALFAFLTLVEKYNDVKHAIKIIDYAFEEACNDPKIKKLYEEKLPFYLYDFEEGMISFASSRFNTYFSKVTDIKLTDEEKKGFIYPIYKGYEKEIEEGKNIFLDFIKKQYPNDSDKIIEIFSNVETVIQDEEPNNDVVSKRRCTIHQMLESELLAFEDVPTKEKYLSIFYNDYENQDNILARFYYRLYIIKKYTKDLYETCIYEYLYRMLKMIDFKYHITCENVTDQSFRKSKVDIAIDVLAKRGINISDSYINLLTIALLDRKYATFDEAAMFAELEQFGDAIYELAVDDILFYDPEFKTSLNHQEREKYVNANAQVKVARAIGLDKAYISKLDDEFNNKYDDYELYTSGLNTAYEKHYLADSLEMVVAVVAKEYGIQKALDFATSIILEANPDLNKPLIFKNFDFVKLSNDPNIDKDYLAKIYPSPFLNESSYFMEYDAISYALYKILKIAIIGNDTIEKRKYIANGLNRLLSDSYSIDESYQIAVSYLYYGIEQTIKNYKDIVESNYVKLKK